MTIVGIILIIIGAGAVLLNFTGTTPEIIANLPIPFYVWFIVIAVGALMVFLNRRPHD